MSISHARISGVNIPVEKQLYISLSRLYGIGRVNSLDICRDINIDPYIRVKQLDEAQINDIRKHIDANYKVEGDLRGEVTSNIKHLISIGCYRGIRHRRGLPVHGQRTKTNARTRKGKKSGPVAAKKKVAK